MNMFSRIKNNVTSNQGYHSDWYALYAMVLLVSLVVAIIFGAGIGFIEFKNTQYQTQVFELEINSISKLVSTNMQANNFISVRNLGSAIFEREKIIGLKISTNESFIIFDENSGDENTLSKTYIFELISAESVHLGDMSIDVKSEDPFFTFKRAFYSFVTIFCIVFFPLCLILYYYIRSYILPPLVQLSNAFEQTVETGEPIKIQVQENMKLGQFVAQFNLMQEKLNCVQKGQYSSLKKAQYQTEKPSIQEDVLQQVFSSLGQSICYFDVNKNIQGINLDDSSINYFKRFKQKPFNVSDSLIYELNQSGITNHRIVYKNEGLSEINSEILFDIEIDYQDEKIESVKAINLTDGGIAMVATDIALRRQLETSLLRTQKKKSIGILVDRISHDFNNILFLIDGSLELIKLNAKDTEKHLDQIIEATDQASAFINSLMTNISEIRLTLNSVQLSDVIKHIVAVFSGSLDPMYNIITNFNTNSYVTVDKHLFETALMNIILNAVDAMPDGGKIIINTRVARKKETMLTGLDSTKDYSLVEIIDSGHGVNIGEIDNVFDPFYTTKTHGTGLGLSIVLNYLSQSGGYIKCNNRSEGGAIFSILLPNTEKDPDGFELVNEPEI